MLDVDHGDELGENAQTGLFQIVREAIDQAVRRGALTRIEIAVRAVDGGRRGARRLRRRAARATERSPRDARRAGGDAERAGSRSEAR